MTYKPENVKLVITHDGVEQDVICFDECSDISEDQIGWLLDRVSKTKEDSKKSKLKSSRCKDTIDWVRYRDWETDRKSVV